ncbi:MULTISPECIES: YceD family protein [unclassified Aureimonas]|uniref:YceD family protein n=1 Tax=unclassified Aureimonas TaxID=2615206 RepID=UPI0006FE8310|nr:MULTISPECIES: DUF177 domain-containing protein [unclassified Aureimonas]KQT52975.1 metal-binding protein [Aureimonas sp. Leaf427]KQT80434.1 metal-binding protein [Aureimonas sp. Leaf460]
MTNDDAKPRLEGPSFWISVSRLPKNGMPIVFEARADEREALARRLDIPAVEALQADVNVEAWRSEGVRIVGTYRAEVVQSCVVTLDPVRQTIEEEVDLIFVPEQSRLARPSSPVDGELHLDPEGEDIPETYSGDRLDFGEVLSELVALALDPYPRASGIDFQDFDTDPEPEAGKVSPFAKLESLKRGS